MSLKVVFLLGAEQDLTDLKNYLSTNFGQQSWQASYGQIKEAVQRLQAFPESGKIPTEFERLNLTQYRQVIAGMNRILYEFRGDTLYIHLVCDTRKDMRSLLLRRILRVM